MKSYSNLSLMTKSKGHNFNYLLFLHLVILHTNTTQVDFVATLCARLDHEISTWLT